jgi:hypothetical protein
MKFKKHFLLSILFTFTAPVFSQSSYLCIAENSVGFSFNKTQQKWINTNFKVEGKKYLLSKSKQGNWEWKKFGEQNTYASCKSDFNEYGYLTCQELNTINFNKNNLRFQNYYPIGYINKGVVGNEGEDTPSIEIGKCSAIN